MYLHQLRYAQLKTVHDTWPDSNLGFVPFCPILSHFVPEAVIAIFHQWMIMMSSRCDRQTQWVLGRRLGRGQGEGICGCEVRVGNNNEVG